MNTTLAKEAGIIICPFDLVEDVSIVTKQKKHHLELSFDCTDTQSIIALLISQSRRGLRTASQRSMPLLAQHRRE